MNRKDWEAQIFASNLNTTAKMVAVVMGSHGNWNDERNVWPSVSAIADMAGMTRDTAKKYVEALEEQGWLRFVRKRAKNVSEYELTESVVEPFGILATPLRGNQFTKKNEQLSNHSTTEIGQLTNQAESVDESSKGQLTNGAVPVDESPVINLKEPKDKEPKEEPKEVSYLNRMSRSLILKERERLHSINDKGIRNLEDVAKSQRLNQEETEFALSLFLDKDWRPDTQGIARGALAAFKAVDLRDERIERERSEWLDEKVSI